MICKGGCQKKRYYSEDLENNIEAIKKTECVKMHSVFIVFVAFTVIRLLFLGIWQFRITKSMLINNHYASCNFAAINIPDSEKKPIIIRLAYETCKEKAYLIVNWLSPMILHTISIGKREARTSVHEAKKDDNA